MRAHVRGVLDRADRVRGRRVHTNVVGATLTIAGGGLGAVLTRIMLSVR